MRGSKYISSDLKGTFSQIDNDLSAVKVTYAKCFKVEVNCCVACADYIEVNSCKSLAMYDERTDTPVPLMKTFPQTGSIL